MSSGFFNIKEKLFKGSKKLPEYNDELHEYVEVDPIKGASAPRAKILIKPFVIEDFSDIKPALDALREGTTIALVNIRPIKEKDIVELKRAVNKIKKTCDAIGGDIAGFGDDWIVVTPSFAVVDRGNNEAPASAKSSSIVDEDE
ncbi:MAG TPA: cell division protein SepF [Candidatus Nanoarchaeia archaeon]|nr:cell division protein SepF [Candidatus Nanoarchaeia archaeon]